MILNLYYVLFKNKKFLSYSIFNIFLIIFDNVFHKIIKINALRISPLNILGAIILKVTGTTL
jgi:hypothetical protein